ncbi:hypothetical protein DFH08DRAFT_950675 [Mycena albidolilacea]|uniref:Uncharacterized protein n=1 Tax=Mycena albidolilacea TaxID=1033008 RepID=A0AAD7ALL9_9AGAR|nr:hypothetical protein DFH08DRAFT_950675 [Mycena albidolilacea]
MTPRKPQLRRVCVAYLAIPSPSLWIFASKACATSSVCAHPNDLLLDWSHFRRTGPMRHVLLFHHCIPHVWMWVRSVGSGMWGGASITSHPIHPRPRARCPPPLPACFPASREHEHEHALLVSEREFHTRTERQRMMSVLELLDDMREARNE